MKLPNKGRSRLKSFFRTHWTFLLAMAAASSLSASEQQTITLQAYYSAPVSVYGGLASRNNGSGPYAADLAQAGGGVGVGTTNPQAKLDVNGNVQTEGNNFNVESNNLSFTDANGTPFLSLTNGNTLNIANTLYATNGDVGIGVSNPQFPLEAGIPSQTPGGGHTNANTWIYALLNSRASITLTAATESEATNPGYCGTALSSTLPGYIYSILTPTQLASDLSGWWASWNCPQRTYSIYTVNRILVDQEVDVKSDARLKNLVGPLNPEKALGAIAKLKPLYFQWKPETKNGPRPVAGFFAQDVAEAIPEAVTITPNGPHHLRNEENLDYREILAYAVSAVQALSVEADRLKASNTALRFRIAALRKKRARITPTIVALTTNAPLAAQKGAP